MTLPDVLRNTGAALTLAFAVTAMLRPAWIVRITGLEPRGDAGAAELQAVFGGFFGGAAAFAIVTQDAVAFAALGAAWLGAALARIPGALRTSGVAPFGAVVFDAAMAILLLFPR